MMTEHESDSELAGLGARFGDLSRLLAANGPPDPGQLVKFAVDAVPNARHAGLTLLNEHGRPATYGATDSLPREVDALQYRLREGPCLSAAVDDGLVRVDDLAKDGRWTVFGPTCVAELDVYSMFSVQLRLSGEERAALNFYARTPFAFDDLDVAVGAIFAPFAALALQNVLNERRVSHLESALESSRQIGAAMGILMARDLLTSEQAFDALSRASQHLNRKLRDVAAEVALTGQLPAVPARPFDGP